MTLLTLFNTALARLGEYRVSTTDPTTLGDTTEKSLLEKLTLQYDLTRDNLMSQYRWAFAKDFRALTPAWVAMTSVADSGGVVQVTKASHGLDDGTRLLVENTVGSDGRFTVTEKAGNTFKLEGSVWKDSVVAGRYVVVPLFGYAYQFEIPADVLRVNTVNGKTAAQARSQWVRIGKFIHTDAAVASISVVKQVTDVELFPAEFCTALVVQLAADCAMSISGANSDRDGLLRELEAIHIPKARMNNAIDKRQDAEQGVSDSVDSRLGYRSDEPFDPFYYPVP